MSKDDFSDDSAGQRQPTSDGDEVPDWTDYHTTQEGN